MPSSRRECSDVHEGALDELCGAGHVGVIAPPPKVTVADPVRDGAPLQDHPEC